jgi:hypothetical protein
MHFVKGKPPDTQYATHPAACVKRREVALGRSGFEPTHMAELNAIPRPPVHRAAKYMPGQALLLVQLAQVKLIIHASWQMCMAPDCHKGKPCTVLL